MEELTDDEGVGEKVRSVCGTRGGKQQEKNDANMMPLVR